MAILMVDDDQELCTLMREFMEREGFSFVSEPDGAGGLRRILEEPFELVVLDVMLPSLDGFEVLRRVRRRSNVPVILLSARGSPEDRLEGFDAGADDYLPKPFTPAELLARVRAVLRRTEGGGRTGGADLQAGPIRVAPSTRQAWRGGQALDLTDTELDILEMLVRASGRVVARDEIFSALYHRPPSPFERAIDVHVSNLRKKLGADGDRLIRTVRGVGYQYGETS